MIKIAFKGSTAWEAQIGRVWCKLFFPRYWLSGSFIRVGLERRRHNEP